MVLALPWFRLWPPHTLFLSWHTHITPVPKAPFKPQFEGWSLPELSECCPWLSALLLSAPPPPGCDEILRILDSGNEEPGPPLPSNPKLARASLLTGAGPGSHQSPEGLCYC